MDTTTALRSGSARLRAAGLPSGAAEAKTLLGYALGLDVRVLSRAALMGDAMTGEAVARYERLLAARVAGTPVQHLTGSAPFRYLELAVGPGVFIPRPETELLVDTVVHFLDETAQPTAASPVDARVADLCTGTGALALAIATERAHTHVCAVESEPGALVYARRNVQRYRAALSTAHSTVNVVAGDALESGGGPFAAVVSNPPYVPAGQETAEVAASDPATALYGGGADGMDFPGALIVHVRELLAPGGLFVMEHAESQADAVAAALTTAGYRHVAGHADYTGRSRFTTGHAPDGDTRTGGR